MALATGIRVALLSGMTGSAIMEYSLKERYREFNKNCTFEEAPAQLDQLIEIFEEVNLYCYEKFILLLKHWKPEIINSFRRTFDSRRQSNALAEIVSPKRICKTKKNHYLIIQ